MHDEGQWLAALLIAMLLCSCAAPNRYNVALTRFQVMSNYDKLASCFARRGKDREVAHPRTAPPILERFTEPDEIRVTKELNNILSWEVDFRPLGETHTDIDTRIWMSPIGGDERRSEVIDDLRACGAAEVG